MTRCLLPLLLLIMLVGVAVAAVDEPVADFVPAPADTVDTDQGPLVVHPFGHASLALQWRHLTIVVDPVGGARRYAHLPRPQVILVTHGHGDHFDADTVSDLAGEHTTVITPPDVAESIPAIDPVVLSNGVSAATLGVVVTAVPAYNRTEGRLDFHPRGRDNGYVLDLGGIRVYVSGDTEDVSEMTALGAIDVAFLCMNLPWTMSGKQALSAARAIAPRVLYPYHFRNRDGSFADLDALQQGLQAEGVSEVRVLDWY